MAKIKTGTSASAISLPSAPKAGATAAQINANTKAVALTRNKAARKEFSRTKVTSRKK